MCVGGGRRGSVSKLLKTVPLKEMVGPQALPCPLVCSCTLSGVAATLFC